MSERITVGGVRVVQRAPRAARSWSLDLGPWREDGTLAYLAACAQGVVPGPLYMLTSDAARGNLLPDHIASPGLGLGSLGGVGMGPVLTRILGGQMVPTAGVEMSPTVLGPWSQTVPVLPTMDLAVSAWSSSPRTMSWRTVDASGAQITTGNVHTTSTPGGGYWGDALISQQAGVAGVQLRLSYGPGRIGGIRLIDVTGGVSASVPEWVPGMGVPRVSIDDPTRTLRLSTPSQTRTDSTITIREVGL
jgi:hypothetical protein